MKKSLLYTSVLALVAAGVGYWTLDLNHAPGASAIAQEKHSESDKHGHNGDTKKESLGGQDAEGETEHEGEEGGIHLSDQQIMRSGVNIVAAGPGEVSKEIQVMGTIVPNADRMVHVTTRVPGIVSEVEKRLGDQVAVGDVLAVLDSRELAEAKAEYLSALRQEALAVTTLKREENLWRKKISAEQDYLDARTVAETSRITLDAARQRLATLGLSDAEIEALPKQNPRAMSRLEVRSPIAGRVTNREAVRGELISAEKEIFTVADLSTVWVELPVYAEDVPLIREGQEIMLKGPNGQLSQGRVMFASPTIDPQTGASRVVASLNNSDSTWRPGDFVSGAIATGGALAEVTVPLPALQTLKGETVVFVRNNEGFETRVVEIGRRNSSAAEVVFGLFPGDQVASGNTFMLKAEALRAAASHSHAH